MSFNVEGKSHKDSRFPILSPGPKLRTSISQIQTPTTFSLVYNSNERTQPQTILTKLPLQGFSTVEKKKDDQDGGHNNGVGGVESEVNQVEDELIAHNTGLVSTSNLNEDRPRKMTPTPNYVDNYDRHLLECLERQILVDHPDGPAHTKTENIPPFTAEHSSTPHSHSDSSIDVLNREEKRRSVEPDLVHDPFSLSGQSSVEKRSDKPVLVLGSSGSHSHTSSISSNSGLHNTFNLSGRSSLCDGCSSSNGSTKQSQNPNRYTPSNRHLSGCSNRTRNSSDASDPSFDTHDSLKQEVLCPLHCGLRQESLCGCGPPSVYTNTNDHLGSLCCDLSETITPLTHDNPPLSDDLSYGDHLLCKRVRPFCVRHQGSAANQNALGNLVVITMWVQLSKYRDLQTEQTRQRKLLMRYEKKVDSLVLIVLMLSKQFKHSSSKLHSIQMYLDQMKKKQRSYERSQRRLYVGFVCVSVLCLLQMSSVRNRCLSLIRFFGIFEMIDKMNRARKVASENWRNIPSLLTDFWRIFIFRSRSRLRDRFS